MYDLLELESLDPLDLGPENQTQVLCRNSKPSGLLSHLPTKTLWVLGVSVVSSTSHAYDFISIFSLNECSAQVRR